MTIVWPSTLPLYVNRDGHTRSAGDGRLRSSTDVGPGKVRRRFSSAVRPVAASMPLTARQLAHFEAFWDEGTAGGTLPFWFPAIGLYGFPLRDDDGNRLLTAGGDVIVNRGWWFVRFSATADAPSWRSRAPDLWEVSFNLEILP